MNGRFLFVCLLLIACSVIVSVYINKTAVAENSTPPLPSHKPAIAKKETLNKKIIENRLSPDEKKVFKNQDISDTAEKKRNLSQKMLGHIVNTHSFLSVMPYKDLALYNVNTEEKLEIIFWADGQYIPEALNELDQFMRDWRNNQVLDIDPTLYMLLYDLYEEVDGDAPIHLISGHRSKSTNDMLRARGQTTSKKSQHTLGKAADITIPGVPVSVLRKKALELKRGGVGYYPKSGFVHVDTGKIRQW